MRYTLSSNAPWRRANKFLAILVLLLPISAQAVEMSFEHEVATDQFCVVEQLRQQDSIDKLFFDKDLIAFERNGEPMAIAFSRNQYNGLQRITVHQQQGKNVVHSFNEALQDFNRTFSLCEMKAS